METGIVYPKLSEETRVRKLAPPAGPIRMVMDTDTFNEIDDQFAVIYALLCREKLQVEAFYAAPFHNELSNGPRDGMEKSYNELLKIRSLMDREDIPVYRGSEAYMQGAVSPVDSVAARDLVERAMACDPEEPLYVVAIGAITNVASAIVLEPRIIERIVVVWLGGHSLEWTDTREFNLIQDVHASRVLFDSGVPLVQVPCMGVASNLTTTLSELRDYVLPSGRIGEYLYETYRNCSSDHYAYSRVIWDISVIAWLMNPESVPSHLTQSPRISDDGRWSVDATRHLIRYARFIHRDLVFRDLFKRISAAGERK